MKRIVRRYVNIFLAGSAVLAAAPVIWGQTAVIPQVADGGGWQTTLVLSNSTAATAAVSVACYQETSGGATVSWTPPFLESVNLASISLSAGGTLFLHTSGSSSGALTGWCQVTGSGVNAYAIYTFHAAGRPDQDATAPGVAAATRVLVPFDNTGGLATAIAIANPAGASEPVSVNIKTDTGATSTASLAALPAQGHTSFLLQSQVPSTGGARGLVEFYTSGAGLSIIALRANPSGGFTSAPVYSASGTPILGGTGGGGGGGGTIPTYSVLTLSGTFSPTGAPDYVFAGAIKSSSGSYAAGSVGITSATFPIPTVLSAGANFSAVSVSNNTFTFSGLIINGTSAMTDGVARIYGITAATWTVTLTPGATPTSGTVSGTLSMTSPLATLTGTISGGYIATP